METWVSTSQTAQETDRMVQKNTAAVETVRQYATKLKKCPVVQI